MHGVEMLHIDSLKKLKRPTEHLLSQSRVDGKHSVVKAGMIGTYVTYNGQKQLLHLVGRHLYMATHALVINGNGEVPVITIAGMVEGGTVTKSDHSTDTHIRRTIGLKGEVRGLHRFAET